MANNTPGWQDILGWAREGGFPLAGAVAIQPPPEAAARFRDWLTLGRHGFLRYMQDTAPLRRDPREWLPWARSVLCVALPYNTRTDVSADWTHLGRLWVSRYAWGRDYHTVMRSRLRPLARRLTMTGARARVFVDSAPLLERSYAVAAGLGFVGKNALLVNPRWGSYLFLGEIATDLEPPPSGAPPVSCGCGSCDLCVGACPAGALRGPGDLDAGRCISAWTVEPRGEKSPGSPNLHDNLFGCDRCQEVCPFNREAPLSADPDFEPREPWFAPRSEEILGLSQEGWDVATRGTALRRRGYEGLLRSARRASFGQGPGSQ
jgi:epoxyqueuosine reductase